jgi:putative DNA primase/helicase
MSNPTFEPAKRVLGLLDNVQPCGHGWSALCPAHDDNRASLSVAEGDDGRLLMKCHAGCNAEEIVEALNLEMKDLFMMKPSATLEKNGRREEKIYSYRDEVGSLLYQTVRYYGKHFRPRRPGTKGGWIYDLEGVRRVLYNLPDVITATHVVITEGEKDANRAKKVLPRFKKWKKVRQWAATTCSGGAAGWRAEYAPYFAGKCVYILPDNDPLGRKFAHTVA